MENKENSGDSANSTSSEENKFSMAPLEVKLIVGTEGNTTKESESNTQDLSLRLELDESGSLKETQDEYRMFSRIGSSSDETKHASQCDKDAQDLEMSKTMDDPQNSLILGDINSSKGEENNCSTNTEENIEVTCSNSNPRSSIKRPLDSQGKKLFYCTHH